jgi:hypothetical protein
MMMTTTTTGSCASGGRDVVVIERGGGGHCKRVNGGQASSWLTIDMMLETFMLHSFRTRPIPKKCF